MSIKVQSPLPDGEYDIDVSTLLLDDTFEENFGIRYGFVPESMDDNLPFQLVRDTTTNSATEETYLMKAESAVSATEPILFEGRMTKGPDSAISSSDYVLVYDSVGKNFKLEKFNGMIRMSKSRNGTNVLNKIQNFDQSNMERSFDESFKEFTMKRQQSIKPHVKVRNIKPIIPQAIPTGTKLAVKSKPVSKKVNSGKISTSKIRETLKKKNQLKSSPLIQSFKQSPRFNSLNSNADVKELSLDKLPESDSSVIPQPKASEWKKPNTASPTSAEFPSRIGGKRLPSSQLATPVLAQLSSQQEEIDSDSDLASLTFQLEEALDESDNDEKPPSPVANDDDDWGEPNMDWDIDDEFDAFGNDDDSKFNIVVEESPLSQPDKKPVEKPVKPFIEPREGTPTGPISMKELASLRSNGYNSNVLTPLLASAATFKPVLSSTITTPRLLDDIFVRAGSQRLAVDSYDEDEDISEEE